ncbi:MAG: MTH938/NDUFAF3 family protein [Pseudomonadota bacterium]
MGTIMREAHFPDRAPVDAYGNGGFRFAGMSHVGAILCLPSGIYGWAPNTSADLTDTAVFEQAVSEGKELELLLVGTGRDLVPLAPNVREHLAEYAIRTEVMSTGAAIRTFNVLLGEGRRVGAALLPVA